MNWIKVSNVYYNLDKMVAVNDCRTKGGKVHLDDGNQAPNSEWALKDAEADVFMDKFTAAIGQGASRD